MSNTVLVKTYSAPPFNRGEILRYAGAREGNPEIDALLDDCLRECDGRMQYRVCYTDLPISLHGEEIDLSFVRVRSRSLSINLLGCERIVLFCATVGLEADRLVSRYSDISPSRAAMFDAIGSERAEALCDAFCREIRENIARDGYKSHPRFSPGYGDLDIEVQADIFRILDPARRIGVSLNTNMIMSPSKSVTAIIGIEKDK